MTDQKLEVNPEQASSNFYWTLGHEQVFNLQTTVRGILSDEQVQAHLETVIRMCKAVVEHGGQAKQVGEYARKAAKEQPAPPPQEAREDIGVGPYDGTFEVEAISVRTEDGKSYYKAKGGMFSTWGVTVWPETIKAADLDPSDLGKLPPGLKAAYINNDEGKPKKVIAFIK